MKLVPPRFLFAATMIVYPLRLEPHFRHLNIPTLTICQPLSPFWECCQGNCGQGHSVAGCFSSSAGARPATEYRPVPALWGVCRRINYWLSR